MAGTVLNKIDIDQIGYLVNPGAVDHGDVTEVGSLAWGI